MTSPSQIAAPLSWPLKALLFLAPALLGALIFYQTTAFAEVWDDAALLLNPLNGPSAVGFGAALADSLRGFSLSPALYWRPLGSLSFWAPHQICSPQNPACLLLFGRWGNYALYAALSLAISALAWRLGGLARRSASGPQDRAASTASSPSPPEQLTPARATIASAFASALVILHPANAEIFAWISARFDGMLALFVSLALFCALSPKSAAPAKAVLVFVFCSLAQLSKDGAAIGCVLLGAVSLFAPMPARDKKAVALACLASVAACSALRWGFTPPMDFSQARVKAEPAAMLHRYVSSSAQALSSLAQPWVGVGPAHPIQSGVSEWIQSALLHLLAAASVIGLWRSSRAGAPSALFFAFASALSASLLISCGLNAVLILNQDFVWADRYLAPSWPFLAGSLALGLPMLWRAARRPALRLAPPLFLMAIGALFALTLNQEVKFWRDNPTFWARVVRADPGNIKSVNNYAHALLQSGSLERAHEQARRGLALMEERRIYFPENVRTAALIQFRLGQRDEAYALLSKWEELGFDSFDLRAQRAVFLYWQGECDRAQAERARAIDFAASLPRYKSAPDLALLERLSVSCSRRSDSPSAPATNASPKDTP